MTTVRLTEPITGRAYRGKGEDEHFTWQTFPKGTLATIAGSDAGNTVALSVVVDDEVWDLPYCVPAQFEIASE